MTAKEYAELAELAAIEPVGNDALIYQMAIAAQAFSGGRLDSYLVLYNKKEMTPEEIAKALGHHGNNRES
jgi:hypothetical protein